MRNLNKFLSAALLLLAMLPLSAQNQGGTPPTGTEEGWFVGVQGGMPFGISTFSSFGADKTRAGFSGGAFVGYRIDPVISLELNIKWGKTALSARDCCASHHYWLGADGIRYHAPVLDAEGHAYTDLRSDVALQHYGIRLNANILGFFASTRQSRWTLGLAPQVAVLASQATLKTLADGTEVSKGSTHWCPTLGFDLNAAYRLTKHLHLGIYSGVTWLTGKERMDGIPRDNHRTNYLWESGIRISYTLNEQGKEGQR